MKKMLFALTCLFAQWAYTQVSTEELNSSKLGASRKVTLIAPQEYNKKEKYPLIVVLNADKLLEPVVSSVRYFVREGEMPACAILGIYNNEEDVFIDEQKGVPFNDSAHFFEFVGQEAIPYIANKYNLNNFKLIIADDDAANFSNYYLLKENSLFNAYLSLAPNLLGQTSEPLASQLQSIEKPLFYYLAWSDMQDVSEIEKTQQLNSLIKGAQKKENTYYYSDTFTGVSPAAVSPIGIPQGLNVIFKDFSPISMREYAEQILKIDGNIVKYIEDKYKKISVLYDINKKPLIGDIKAIYAAILKKGELESLPELSNFIKKSYKDTALPDFFEGEYYERTGLPKKAFKSYQRAYSLKDIDFVTKEYLSQKLEKLQKTKNK